MTKTQKNILFVAIGIVVLLLVIRVVFDEKFDNFDRFVEERENYEGGTEKFDENFENMTNWIDTYKEDHPDATDADVDAAWKEAWGNQ